MRGISDQHQLYMCVGSGVPWEGVRRHWAKIPDSEVMSDNWLIIQQVHLIDHYRISRPYFRLTLSDVTTCHHIRIKRNVNVIEVKYFRQKIM